MSKKVSGSERWPMVAGGGDIGECSITVKLGSEAIELVETGNVPCVVSVVVVVGCFYGGRKRSSLVIFTVKNAHSTWLVQTEKNGSCVGG